MYWRAAFTFLAGIALTAAIAALAFYFVPGLDWSDESAPAWVQGIGSIVAILVAISVAIYQTDAQRARDKAVADGELRGLLLSLRSELLSNLSMLEVQIGPIIRAKPPGEPFYTTYPLPEDPFHVYNALLPRLATMTDDSLRDSIVNTYTLAKGFVLTVRFNNGLLAHYEGLKMAEANGNIAAAREANRQLPVLCQYGDSVKESYDRTKVIAESLAFKLGRI